MIIYELIYYWDDQCDGIEITETKLLLNRQEVDNKIIEFTESSRSIDLISTEINNKNTPNKEYFYFNYENGSSCLEIRKHNI